MQFSYENFRVIFIYNGYDNQWMETASTFNDDVYVLRENLRNLRTAFFVLFIGLILTMVPFVDIVGGILIFIGIILLIMGLGRIGNSNLTNAKFYLGARNWFVFYILASIAVVVVIYYFLFTLIVSPIIASSLIPGSVPPVPMTVFNDVFMIMGASVAVILVLYVITYLKLAETLKLLSSELSVPKLGSAGDYLKISIILSVITSFIAVASLYYTFRSEVVLLSSHPGHAPTGFPVSPVFSLFGVFGYTFLVAIVGLIFQLIAYHGAYSGLDEFFTLADYKMQNRQ